MLAPNDIDDVTDPVKTEMARSLLAVRYFHHPRLKLEGLDGIDQNLDHEGRLVGLSFPDRYAARRDRPDIQATLHEMGHFVTLPPRRIVQPGFGFAGGIPELGWEPWRHVHVVAVSHVHESTAFAWEHILLQDLFGIDIPVRDIVSSLRYAPDFFCYPGAGEREKIDWVAELTTKHVTRFRTGLDFDDLWSDRMTSLEELIAAENERMAALEMPPISETQSVSVYADWKASIGRHELGTTVAWRTTLVDGASGEQTSRDFETQAGAERWIRAIQDSYCD